MLHAELSFKKYTEIQWRSCMKYSNSTTSKQFPVSSHPPWQPFCTYRSLGAEEAVADALATVLVLVSEMWIESPGMQWEDTVAPWLLHTSTCAIASNKSTCVGPLHVCGQASFLPHHLAWPSLVCCCVLACMHAKLSRMGYIIHACTWLQEWGVGIIQLVLYICSHNLYRDPWL